MHSGTFSRTGPATMTFNAVCRAYWTWRKINARHAFPIGRWFTQWSRTLPRWFWRYASTVPVTCCCGNNIHLLQRVSPSAACFRAWPYYRWPVLPGCVAGTAAFRVLPAAAVRSFCAWHAGSGGRRVCTLTAFPSAARRPGRLHLYRWPSCRSGKTCGGLCLRQYSVTEPEISRYSGLCGTGGQERSGDAGWKGLVCPGLAGRCTWTWTDCARLACRTTGIRWLLQRLVPFRHNILLEPIVQISV
jgi:hypothetical protein